MAEPKLFTVAQAERALKLVRRIVADIVKTYRRRHEVLAERQAMSARLNPGSDAEARAFELERSIQTLADEILRYQQELFDIGVELKDYRMGLIDFYSRYGDRLVYLCWKLDEGDRIAFWHELEDGFVGRQPLTDEHRAAFEGTPAAPKKKRSTRKQELP